MNAEQLLTHFDRVADAPDAIPRLRRFVLDLAVRGKLVEQDPEDEPAAELLKRIAVEKKRLVKAGTIRRGKVLPTIEIDEIPFSIPATWRWVRFGNIADFSAGRTPPRNEPAFWNTGDYPWISIADMDDGEILTVTRETVSEESAKKIFRSDPEQIGTMIMSFKLTIGKIARLGVPAYHNEAIISIRPHVSEFDPYLFKVLPFFARQGDTKGAIKGATLNRESISNIWIPLPSLAEQHRIVAKVDELMALCDRLETARKERKTTRNRLMAASLARFNAPDPDPVVFRNDATFALDNLTPLTARPGQIKALRQTILNLAVRGKLVDQDPGDEPAGELLKRIAAEKAQLIKAGEIRKPKVLPSIDESPFDIPPSWEWRALRDLVCFENGDRSRNYPSGSDIKTVGVPFFNTKNISDYAVKFDQLDFITEEKFKSLRSGKMKDLDILITLRGSVGKLGLFQATEQFTTGFINAQLLIIRNFERGLVRFCLTFMKSQTFLDQILDRSSGSATPQLSASQLSEVVIPLPPLAEQHRIVAKVAELVALCDRLEASLAAGDETRGRLVEAVLYEALASGKEQAG